MSKTISFKVNLTFSEEITRKKDIQEIARNIARAIRNEANGAGIASDDADAFTEKVEVSPVGMDEFTATEILYDGEGDESEMFARKCTATGIGMNSGFCWMDGEEYFSTQELALARIKQYIKENDIEDEMVGLSDAELLEWAHDEDICYYTEWGKDDMIDERYLEDGTFIEAED